MKEGEGELFKTDSGVRQWCVMSSQLFKEYMNEVMKQVEMGIRFQRKGESGMLAWV